jgi:esterase/lipase superfamily enzyme
VFPPVRVFQSIAAVTFLLLALSGCAGQTHQLVGNTIAPVAASKIAGNYEIFVATSRAKAADPRVAYSGDRSKDLNLAQVDITVPAIHTTGAVERPVGRQTDPAKYFTATRVAAYRDEEAFSRALRADIARRGGRAMVFIHGYNTAFDDAIYRITQIVHDSGYKGTPILFTWASAGRTVDYVYDNNSATAARDRLEDTLRLVARSGAKRVDIVAHSMGNWVTVEALRQLAMTGDRDLDGKMGDVVLASPDIDVDVFKTQMGRYGVPDKPFVVLTSKNDRALSISGLIAGQRPRLGDYTDAADIAQYGVIVADVSTLSSGDSLNHAKFADNPVLVKLLGERLQSDNFGQNESEITDRIGTLTRGIGQTLTSAAEIVITTPFEVMRVAVGQ